MEENKENIFDNSDSTKAVENVNNESVEENTEADKFEVPDVNSLLKEEASESSSVDEQSNINASEENGRLEYATMPGSWASYEAEREKERVSRGNGVYPDGGEPQNSGGNFPQYNGESPNGNESLQNSSEDNRGYSGYFGSYGGYNSVNPWKNPSKKPISKKKWALYVGISALALAIIIVSAIGVFKLFNQMINDLGNTPPTGEQGGGQSGGIQGGTEGGTSGGQSGGTQNGSGTAVTPGTGSSNLQNGSFTLEQVPAEEHYKLSDVYKLTESTVVAIKSSVGSGSGVIISKDEKNNDGYFIVTNNHVIEGGENIKVTLSSGLVYDAVLVGRDENTDLAILKIVAADLKVATVGKSSDLLVAEEVLIIGNPLGTLGGTATNGIVSAKNRVITIDGYAMTLIQTNAAVNPGNSGGAMFNMAGQLVGVVNAKYASEEIEGIGFAIPIDIATEIIEDLINYGYVKGRTNHGFKITYAVKPGIDQYYSWWVTEINTGSDAESAGLKVNDRIIGLKINGLSHSVENLDIDLNALKVGDVINISVRRYSSNGMWIVYDDYEIAITVTEYMGGN